MAFIEQKARVGCKPGLEAAGRIFVRLRISANWVTNIGFLLTVGVAVLAALGEIRWAGLVYVFAAVCDALDGTVARLTGHGSRFGAFWDSTIDRFEESIVLLGLIIHYAQQGGQWEIPLVLVTLVASLMVSYTRARAEAIGVSCKVGLMTRPPRVFVAIAGMILDQVPIALGLVAALSLFTALHRMYHVWRMTGGEDGGWGPVQEPFVLVIPGSGEAKGEEARENAPQGEGAQGERVADEVR